MLVLGKEFLGDNVQLQYINGRIASPLSMSFSSNMLFQTISYKSIIPFFLPGSRGGVRSIGTVGILVMLTPSRDLILYFRGRDSDIYKEIAPRWSVSVHFSTRKCTLNPPLKATWY